MRIKDLKPSTLHDVAAMIALYRPGPMEFIGDFINAKHGRTQITYPHDDLQALLEETYGIVVYQDQVLLIAQRFGGYTLGEADILRKAMGKKDKEVMAAESEKFIAGGIANGYTPELSQQMFNLIEPFAGYAFNKAHSVSYGLISYWTAYLKANYPSEFMVCLLNAYANPVHEERAAAILRNMLPEIYVCNGTELCREWYEYERTSTAASNAYVGPQVSGYIRQLDEGLRAEEFTGTLFMMGSNGGVLSAEEPNFSCFFFTYNS